MHWFTTQCTGHICNKDIFSRCTETKCVLYSAPRSTVLFPSVPQCISYYNFQFWSTQWRDRKPLREARVCDHGLLAHVERSWQKILSVVLSHCSLSVTANCLLVEPDIRGGPFDTFCFFFFFGHGPLPFFFPQLHRYHFSLFRHRLLQILGVASYFFQPYVPPSQWGVHPENVYPYYRVSLQNKILEFRLLLCTKV